MIFPFLLYLLTGVISSFLSGLLGIGGGLIIIPALMFIFSHFNIIDSTNLMHITIGTSLASAIINLVSSTLAHHRQGNIRWPVFRLMIPGVLVGALLIGPAIMFSLPNHALKIIFGTACFFFSLQMILPKKNEGNENLPGKIIFSFLGLLTGTLSILLGLAGGVIIGTILNYYRMDMRKVVGTTASIAIVLSIAGTVSLMVLGSQETEVLPAWSTGFIYWPALLGIALPSPFLAPLGAKAAQRLPVDTLKKLFAALIFIIGIKMLI